MPFPYPFPIIFGEWPSVAVVINDEIQDIVKGSLAVELRIEERSTAGFVIKDTLGLLTFQRGQPITIYDTTDTRIFGGVIDTPGATRIAPSGGLYHPITCMDNHYFADKRLVVKVYTAEKAGDMFKNIIADYLAAEGITEGTIQDGVTIGEAILNYVKASEAFDAIKGMSGNFTWFIDENKVLDFYERATNAAPWALDGVVNRPLKGSVRLDKGNPLYRNRQYVRGGTGLIPEPPATNTETFSGDDVTEAFTVGYPLALVPTVTLDAAGQTIGIKGIDTGKQCYWNKGDSTVTFAAAPPSTAPDNLTIEYNGQYPLISLATNEAQRVIREGIEGGTGINEEMAFEAQHESGASSEASAQAKFIQFCQDAEKYIFQTHKSGLKPGQLFPVTDSSFGFVAHEMLIESVTITAEGSLVTYNVAAITGAGMGSWSRFFSNLLLRQDNTIRLGDNLLLVLLQQAEAIELSEATSRFEDDFSGGEVGRWIALPPAQSEGAHVEHEAIELSESTTRWKQAIADGYCWAPRTPPNPMREAVWDFFSWS